MNSLWRSFQRLRSADPDRPLVSSRAGGRWLTCDALGRQAETLAGRLHGTGFRKGEICGVSTGNHPLFISSVLAVWSLEGVVLPLDDALSRGEREAFTRAFGPSAVIRRAGPRARPEEILGGPRHRHAGCKIRLTSGSTGAPRGALVTAAQLMADGRSIIRTMKLSPGDMNLAALPLGHSYGFDNVVLPLILQGTSALILERPLPSTILRGLRTRRPTLFPSVPYIIDLLARHPDPPPPRSGLRLCISAGAPLPAATAAAFTSRFGVPVRCFYGASEAGGITYDDGSRSRALDGCVGTPLRGVRVTIDRRGLSHLPAGEGRVIVQSRAVAREYLPCGSRDLGAGRFRSSDLGRLDDGGRLHLTGRLSSLVNVSGRKVNPAEVERALRQVEGVRDAVVMGVGDSLRGERVEAWVVAPGLGDAASIRRHLASGLSAWKMPRTLHLVARIPRTARGKVDRLSLLGSRRPAPSSSLPTSPR